MEEWRSNWTEDVEAEIIAYPFEKKIRIRIKATIEEGIAFRSKKEIDLIHRTQNFPDVKEMIPCNCSECRDSLTPYFHAYANLTRALVKKTDKIQCQNSFEGVDVRALISGIETRKRLKYIDGLHSSDIIVYGDYIDTRSTSTIEISEQNIFGGHQQFADKIIASEQYSFSEIDRTLIEFVCEFSSLPEERNSIIECLSVLKGDLAGKNERAKALTIVRQFVNDRAGNDGRETIIDLISNGAEYLKGLV